MSDYIDFSGFSGASYRYYVISNPTAEGLQAVGGNYGFVKPLVNGNYFPLYFGEGKNLSERIPGHEKWSRALLLGATLIVAHSTPSGYLARIAEERDLVQLWNPVLNQQHRTVG